MLRRAVGISFLRVTAMHLENLESRRLMSTSLNVYGELTVQGGWGNDNLSVSQSGSTLTVNDNGAVSSFSTYQVSKVILRGDYGHDSLSAPGVSVMVDADGGYGDDTITGGIAGDLLRGGYGNDVIRGYGAPLPTLILSGGGFAISSPRFTFYLPPADNDTMYGDDGNDTLIGGNDADFMSGGNGADLADYSDRTAGVKVTLDGVANDGSFDWWTGASTEMDNVFWDVENLRGGSGGDILWGSVWANDFSGGAGDDQLYGVGGNDRLDGSFGNDSLSAGDGNDIVRGSDGNDSVDGGTGMDQIDGDAGDDWISAGDANDVVRGGDGNDTIYAGNGDDQIEGNAGADWLYGDDGNDTLRGGDDNDVLFGNHGDDAVFGGAGNDNLFGGDGNDTLVSIGGGQLDYVWGEGGSDSFWVDAEATEVVVDLSPPEGAAGHLHRVGSFFSNTVISNGVTTVQTPSRELNGQNFVDPTVFTVTFSDGTTAMPTYANFSTTPLFGPGGPSTNDIDQNAVGDCYFLAPLSATAKANPDRIRQSVVDLGDGTYAVQYFRGGVANFVRVDGDLPRLGSGGQMAYAGRANNTLWGPIMEKAYAYFRRGDGQYASIASGTADETFGAIGCSNGWWVRPFWQSSGSWLADIQTSINNGQAVTLSTGWPLSGPNLVTGHVYAVDHVEFDSTGHATGVVLRNPWAQDLQSGASSDGVDDGFITISAHDIYWSTLIAHFANV